jgi:signal transduction histidine kinase
LPKLFQLLTKEEQTIFFSLVDSALKSNILSSREERQVRRTLEYKLTDLGIENPENLAYEMTNTGIHEIDENFISLLRSPNANYILKIAYHLVNQKRSTQNITLAVEKASKVVFALKNYSRKDNTDTKVEASITLGIDTVLMLYHSQMKHGVEVVKRIEELPYLLCYPEELNQVWTNLIHNALQAMDYKGTLEVIANLAGNNILVTVKDTGKGIPESIRERVFEAFFTTKPVGQGSGLGLDIVKKIVDKHAGKIYFESEVGRGTTFFVELPLNA